MKRILFAAGLVCIISACGSKTKNAAINQTPTTDSLPVLPNDSAIVKTENILKDTMYEVPVVTLENKEVSEIINAELTLEKISGYTEKDLEAQKKEQEEGAPGGLVTVGYDVVKNKDYVLSIRAYGEGCGAYCTNWTIERSFDLKTGKLIKIEDLIKLESMDALLKICNQQLNANVDAAKKEHENDMSKDDMEIYEGLAFVKGNLGDFCITDDGISFQYDFDFPHVMLFAEPNSYIEVSKAELKDMLIAHVYGL